MLQKIISIAFYLAGLFFLIFVAYLISPYKEEVDAKRVSFALAATFICFAFANIERVSSLGILGMKLTLSEAKKVVAEANVALDQLRGIAVVFSEVLIENLASQGRFGGPQEKKENQKQYLLTALKDLKVSNADLRRVQNSDQIWVKIDYVGALFNFVPQSVAESEEWGERWKSINKSLERPSPDECAVIMKEFNLNESDRKEILNDYKYYMKNFRHRRVEEWVRRYKSS